MRTQRARQIILGILLTVAMGLQFGMWLGQRQHPKPQSAEYSTGWADGYKEGMIDAQQREARQAMAAGLCHYAVLVGCSSPKRSKP